MTCAATKDDYRAQAQALLPPGPAWTREDGATLGELLDAAAAMFSANHNRSCDLTAEAIPSGALELLRDWERVAGLPDTCSAAVATTIQERRAALVGKLTSTGGQSVAYFVRLIAALGYDASVTEYRPFVCGLARCGAELLNGPHAVRHQWTVTVHGPRLTRFRTGASQASDRLGKIARAEDLECLLGRLKPAHTVLHLIYEGA